MAHRLFAARLLLLAAPAVAITSLFWAWVTFNYWEVGPLVGSVSATGILAGSGVYVGRHRLRLAVTVGLLMSLVLLLAVFAITSARWTR